MRMMVSGHRLQKLTTYDHTWIKQSLEYLVLLEKDNGLSLAYSGMASGIDLWFLHACNLYKIPYIACIPFDNQDEYMNDSSKIERENLLQNAKEKKIVRNVWMVENSDIALIVWDGNKGGTHNVVQQLIEKNINFHWINPVGKKIWSCL